MKITAQMRKRDFESREVYKATGLKSALMPTGYEAYRVSPRTTMKFGTDYKKIYGATITPNWNDKKGKNKFGVRVQWFPHGYTTKSAKSGTFLLQSLRLYPIDVKEAKRKLMMK